MSMPEWMTTQEVAEYLRLKERKIYDLVRQRRIPCARVAGKWLFPKAQIDQWLADNTDYDGPRPRPADAPPVVAGSHDPLLAWCLAESGCGLALLTGGSLDGLHRLAQGQARIAGSHILDPERGDYNVSAIETILAGRDVVAIEWAVREQGLILPPGNPRGVTGVADLACGLRIADRPSGAGSHRLLRWLAARAGIAPEQLTMVPGVAHGHLDVGLAVLEGRADTGLAIRAVARQLKLDFLPLQRERYDLVLRRRDYFEAPMQTLLDFARRHAPAKAADLQGYDVGGLGRVRYNAPV